MNPNIKTFIEPVTWSITHMIFDVVGGSCATIDTVLDYEAKSGRISTQFTG